jgi:type VI secretion system protein ImpF
MAELRLSEQLQPSLLDRLLDEERFVTLIQVCAREFELQRIKMRPSELTDFLTTRGIKVADQRAAHAPPVEAGEIELWFSAPGRSVGLQPLKDAVVRAPGAPQGLAVHTFCRIHALAVLNSALEPAERRLMNMRRLRESVFRDLRWLLNTASLDTTEELERYPGVARSVLNFGMPALAGKTMSSVDPRRTADRMAQAIRCFEPRLGKVKVTPEKRALGGREFALEFKIEAELWGQPAPQHLLMNTRIDLDSGHVSVGEDAGR